MRIILRSDSEMSYAELSALWTLQRTGRLHFELSEAEKREGVRRGVEAFLSLDPDRRDAHYWVIVRLSLRKLDPKFADLSFEQAIAGLGTRRKSACIAAHWSCAVTAFGDDDLDDAKARFRDATPARLGKAVARRERARTRRRQAVPLPPVLAAAR